MEEETSFEIGRQDGALGMSPNRGFLKTPINQEAEAFAKVTGIVVGRSVWRSHWKLEL